MTTVAQPPQHWRDRAIAGSEIISDSWQVALAYTGRGAEIVLFFCMIVSIVEMAPMLHMWPWLANGTLVVQMITLDVAGFGLNSLAKAVRRSGDEQAAQKAEKMGNALITIMIVSLISVAVKNLFSASVPGLDTWMGYLDDVLILIRVAATVKFGHIIHDLRESQQLAQVAEDTRIADLQNELHELQRTHAAEKHAAESKQSELQAKMTSAKSEQAEKINKLSQHLAEVKAALETRNAELSHLQNLLSNSQNESSMKALQYNKNELSWKSEMQVAVKAARDEMKAQMKAESLAEMKALQEKIDALSRGNTELKAQLKGQAKTPVKPVKQLPSEKFDTRTFVFSCLQENAEMKLSDIVQAAKLKGQELSEPTISRYRKEYRESSTVVENESSTMKA